MEKGELSRGIMTDPVATLAVWQALPEEHRPTAPEDGPRISERLAARLGPAYLSFNAPELVVTGKPHAPTTKLMRGGNPRDDAPGLAGPAGTGTGFVAQRRHRAGGIPAGLFPEA